MPARTQCPSCRTDLAAPDGPPGRRVRCPFCAAVFVAKLRPEPEPVPEVLPARTTPADQRLQIDREPRVVVVRPERPADEGRREPDVVARRAPRKAVGMIVGIGLAAAGVLIVLVGGGMLAWMLLSPSPSPAPVATPPAGEAPRMAEAPPPAPVAPPPLQPAAGPPAVPEAPAAAGGEEEFVDLPERDENIPAAGGLNPGRQPAPAERPRVALTRVRVSRVIGQPRMSFQVDYRFEQGAPDPGARYGWVIVTSRGIAYKQSLPAGGLQAQGTLQGQPPLGVSRLDAPYRTYLVVEVPGMPEEKISNELTAR